jgi:4-hydroxy-3-methylbut-2-enyl diphosphate reductase
MRILLASPRGFCAGVNMAIESLQWALKTYGLPMYVYHEIVHNRWVVESFQAQGVVFVNELTEVPEGAHMLFSAHGVSPAVRRQASEQRLLTIDATCPLVTKVHREAIRFAAQGYTVVLIGHAGHDEVVGTMGEAPRAIVLVSTIADVDQLKVANPSKVAYLTQTTLSIHDADRIIARLRERFPEIIGPPREDICYATQSRQEAVCLLAKEADIVLVVGSTNSSNSKRLAELAKSQGVAAYLIDGPDDIDVGWFSSDTLPNDKVVVITAGASAPESVVQQCVALLQKQFNASVESRIVREENLRFSLPKTLREQA